MHEVTHETSEMKQLKTVRQQTWAGYQSLHCILVQDLANSIPKGGLDWERALRCLRHALRTTPSPDWWRRVLLVAPCYRSHSQTSTPGAVFSPDMIGEAVADRTIELLKLTNSGQHLGASLFVDSSTDPFSSGWIPGVHGCSPLLLNALFRHAPFLLRI